jgi:cell wall assembly regulator SMI1
MTNLEQPKKTSEAQLRAIKKWRENNQEEYNAYLRDWTARNPEKSREARFRHRLKYDVKLKLRIEELMEEETT